MAMALSAHLAAVLEKRCQEGKIGPRKPEHTKVTGSSKRGRDAERGGGLLADRVLTMFFIRRGRGHGRLTRRYR